MPLVGNLDDPFEESTKCQGTAIHGNYTAGGVPILGGDPHLLGTHPSAFYRWNLHVTGGEEKERSYSGVCIPLVPSFTNFHSPFYSTG